MPPSGTEWANSALKRQRAMAECEVVALPFKTNADEIDNWKVFVWTFSFSPFSAAARVNVRRTALMKNGLGCLLVLFLLWEAKNFLSVERKIIKTIYFLAIWCNLLLCVVIIDLADVFFSFVHHIIGKCVFLFFFSFFLSHFTHSSSSSLFRKRKLLFWYYKTLERNSLPSCSSRPFNNSNPQMILHLIHAT